MSSSSTTPSNPAAPGAGAGAGAGGAASEINIPSILANSLSPDAATRSSATQQLEQLQESNFAEYLLALTSSFSSPSDPASNPSHIRNAAGLAVKNALAARETSRAEKYSLRWRNELEDGVRSRIKEAALATLADQDGRARNVAGQVVAAIAHIELPSGMWNGLISQLLEFVKQQEYTGLRQSSLQAIGFVCEGMVSGGDGSICCMLRSVLSVSSFAG